MTSTDRAEPVSTGQRTHARTKQMLAPGLRRQDPSMSTDVSGMIECRPGARLWGPDDEDSVWEVGINLFLLNRGNSYDGLACLFGIRNSFGFRPLAEDVAFPITPQTGCEVSSPATAAPTMCTGPPG